MPKKPGKAERLFEFERISAESYQAIGHFIVLFSLLEYLTRLVLAEQLALGEFTATVTGALDFRMLCKITHTVLIAREPERAKQLDRWYRDCMALNDKRNHVAHGEWTLGSKGPSVSHVSRNTLKPEAHFGTVAELKKLTDEAGRLGGEIASFLNAMRAVTP